MMLLVSLLLLVALPLLLLIAAWHVQCKRRADSDVRRHVIRTAPLQGRLRDASGRFVRGGGR